MSVKPLNVMFVNTFSGVIVILLALASLQASAKQVLPDFTGLVEEHTPAVVKIETRPREGSSSSPNIQLPDNIPEIFRHYFEQNQPRRRTGGIGSGFLVSADGYILTNNHVVDGDVDITVRLVDRREFAASVIGLDPQSDLALLKIDAKDLPFLKFADSDKVKVGEWVLAIGSPFGLDYSVSAGIVSAIGRNVPSNQQQNYVPFIQTDVAINPGNSGGPLFNLDGEVVGINSQIITNSGGSIGLSFAIPANLAQNVIEQLKTSGKVDRGWLGVVIQDVDKDLAESFGLDKPRGALIAQIDPNGPGKKSGLKVSDIILSFNNKDIQRSSDLPLAVGPVKPGVTVPATIMRKGKKMTLDITVGSRSRPQSAEASLPLSDTRLGAAVKDLDEKERESLNSDGVLVTEVSADSAAAKAGLRQGDVIVELGFEEIDSVERFLEIEKDLPTGKPLPMRFIRQGSPVFRSIVLEK